MTKNKYKNIEDARQKESFNISLMSLPPALRKRFTGLSRIEKAFYVCVAVAAIALASSLVFVRMQVYRVQAETNQMRLNMLTSQKQIVQFDQDLRELTSDGKVSDVANQSGLTKNNGLAETIPLK